MEPTTTEKSIPNTEAYFTEGWPQQFPQYTKMQKDEVQFNKPHGLIVHMTQSVFFVNNSIVRKAKGHLLLCMKDSTIPYPSVQTSTLMA
jgi:hypothetical protein